MDINRCESKVVKMTKPQESELLELMCKESKEILLDEPLKISQTAQKVTLSSDYEFIYKRSFLILVL